MSEDPPPGAEVGEKVETYDHSVPKGMGAAAIVSLFFFGGGQLIKGQFRRALGLWGLLVAVVTAMGFIASFTQPESTIRTVGIAATVSALIALWLYQLWDAASRP